MYIVFYSTTDVYKAEELFDSKHLEYELVPTPVKGGIHCGICIKTDEVSAVIEGVLENYHYVVIT